MGYATRSSSKDDRAKNGKETEQTNKKRKPENNSASEETSCPDDESDKSSAEDDETSKTPTKKKTDISGKNSSGEETESGDCSTQKEAVSTDSEEEEENLTSTKKRVTCQTSASVNKEHSNSKETQQPVSKDIQPSVRPKIAINSKKADTKSTQDNCPRDWKTLIVDLKTKDGQSVCIVSERWIHPWKHSDVLLYPTKHTPAKTEKAVREHEEPNDTYEEFEFVTRKICGKRS